MQRHEIFKELEQEWHKLFDQYETIKATLPPIVKWEWTNRSRYDIRPFYFERHPSPGRILKQVSEDMSKRNFYHEYGFDAQNRLVIERSNKGKWESFYSYAIEKVTIMTFSSHQGRHLLRGVVDANFHKGNMQRYVSLTTDYSYIDSSMRYPAAGQLEPYRGVSLVNTNAETLWSQLQAQKYAVTWKYEDYVYQEKQLILIQSYTELSLFTPLKSETRFEYGDKNILERIRRTHANDHKSLVYRRRKQGETLGSVTKLAKEKLIEAIPKVVGDAKLNEPLYCLNLYYFLAQTGDYFPPKLLMGYERDRQRKLMEVPPEGAVPRKLYVSSGIWWYLWQYEEENTEIPYRLSIHEPAAIEACENLEVEINSRQKSSLAIKTLYEICQELNQLDWSRYTPVTDDFIVYACDQTEHTAPSISLRRSGAGQEQLKNWRKLKILV